MKTPTKYYFFIFFIALLYNHTIVINNAPTTSIQGYDLKMNTNINNLDKLAAIFPKSITEIKDQTNAAQALAQQEIDAILKNNIQTFDSTMRALDITLNKLKTLDSIMQALGFIHPNTEIRQEALQANQTLQEFIIDIAMNIDVYHVIQNYYDNHFKNENTSTADQLLITDYLNACKRLGLHLPPSTLEQVKQLKKEIASIEQEFSVTINNDDSYITATAQELTGVNDDFIKQLTKNGDTYIIPCKLATAIPIMTECSVEETRKKMFFARSNIAYPQNESLLIQLLKKRQELAVLLGYSNFASLDLESIHAQVNTVEDFLLPLAQQCLKKQTQEINDLKNNLPATITLQKNGTLNQWDYPYAYNEYIKKNFAIDESKIAEYFPAQKVIDGIFVIYQDLLDLTFKQVQPKWSWHEDVILIEIYRKSSQELLGYLFLDLYPRANKYSHACVAPHVVSFNESGKNTTSIATLIANFPKPSADMPALWKFQDVITFFHEFGHAMHNVLSRTQHAGQAGLNVSMDFAEVPSQMFEQWMFEPDMLNIISSHYKTGEKLPKDIIENKIKLRKINSGSVILRQCMLSLFALYTMTNETLSYDPHALWKSLHDKYLSHTFTYEDNNHHFATFGHLAYADYACKYYTYLWTNVFALDLFTAIKAHNFNKKYSQKVINLLSAGSSVKADELLQNFLGRKPNQQAFLTALGLE